MEMHEVSITTQIVESVKTEATEQKARKVLEVYLQIGCLTFLNPEQVKFWYEILTKDTILEGSRLVAEEVRGSVHCSACGYSGGLGQVDSSLPHMLMPTLQCPECNGVVKVVDGRDCVVKRIKMLI
ncbi:hydrogenase maturation nickel metallochaperone HypA [Candidatus Bathyarchaeota archaeon]|nr:hydrogenase maturation nickel metallochaperone HypA [Candidatus Bathyarchaeota archaeon]